MHYMGHQYAYLLIFMQLPAHYTPQGLSRVLQSHRHRGAHDRRAHPQRDPGAANPGQPSRVRRRVRVRAQGQDGGRERARGRRHDGEEGLAPQRAQRARGGAHRRHAPDRARCGSVHRGPQGLGARGAARAERLGHDGQVVW